MLPKNKLLIKLRLAETIVYLTSLIKKGYHSFVVRVCLYFFTITSPFDKNYNIFAKIKNTNSKCQLQSWQQWSLLSARFNFKNRILKKKILGLKNQMWKYVFRTRIPDLLAALMNTPEKYEIQHILLICDYWDFDILLLENNAGVSVRAGI